jgi:hypothetical protein
MDGVDRAPQHSGPPVERHPKDPLARVPDEAGEPATVPAKQRAEGPPPGEQTMGSTASRGDPERELAPDRGRETQAARPGSSARARRSKRKDGGISRRAAGDGEG